MNLVSRIVPDSATHPLRRTDIPLTAVVHTNGAGNSVASLYNYIVSSKTRIYPHYQNARDGTLEQYVPIERQAFVQYDGNPYVISVENQDSGYNALPINQDPFSDAQLRSMAELFVSLGIPPRLCTTPLSGGVGYHSQFSPEWNRGHNCPGAARTAQIPKIVEYMTTSFSTAAAIPPVKVEDMASMIQVAGNPEIDAYDGITRRRLTPSEFAELGSVLGGTVHTVSQATWDGIPVYAASTNPSTSLHGTWSTA